MQKSMVEHVINEKEKERDQRKEEHQTVPPRCHIIWTMVNRYVPQSCNL